MVAEQVEEQDKTIAVNEVEQGIVPIVEHLKAHGFKVLYWADIGDEVFRSPMIWVYNEDYDAGLRAVDVCREFARQRGYELSQLRREWNYVEELADPESPHWRLVFF